MLGICASWIFSINSGPMQRSKIWFFQMLPFIFPDIDEELFEPTTTSKKVLPSFSKLDSDAVQSA